MDKLLQPDLGLIITTIVTFLILVWVLKKAAWKPILEGLNKREGKIRDDLGRAEKAQADAEALRRTYETQLAEAQKAVQDLVTKSRADGERARGEMLAAAKAESERIIEKGRKDLAGETERLKEELQGSVAELSVVIAEKILRRSIDPRVQEEVLRDSLQSINGGKR